MRSDLDALRGKCRTVAVNCAVFFAPWADVLYASDRSWWKYYGPKVQWFKGIRISRNMKAPGVQPWKGKGWKRTGGNSGHLAIQYAVDQGGRNLAIIGFDHQKTNGKAHCHEDHPQRPIAGVQLGNVDGIHNWPKAMDATAQDLKHMGVKVVNLSRETALTCFPRMTVEEFLCHSH